MYPLLCKLLSNHAAIWYDIAIKHWFGRIYTMTDVQHRAAARQFAADWKDRGDEKQETQAFWLALLQKVFGVDEPEKYISFERRVEVDDTRTGKSTTKFIDGYIPQTRVLIEQKGRDIVLTRGYKQSDGYLLSP